MTNYTWFLQKWLWTTTRYIYWRTSVESCLCLFP